MRKFFERVIEALFIIIMVAAAIDLIVYFIAGCMVIHKIALVTITISGL